MAFNDFRYPRYVGVGEKRDKADKQLAKLKKLDPEIQPVILIGSKLVHTWWGKAWNQNLESYGDYSNRIGRGRSYIRQGAVLDLRITAGLVTALVQGSARHPYRIEIKIDALKPATWQSIKAACAGKLASLQELLDGKFPKELAELFYGFTYRSKTGQQAAKQIPRKHGALPRPP